MEEGDGATLRKWAAAGALILLIAILSFTLSPAKYGAEAAAATPLLCLVCGQSGGTDVVLNLMMLAPLGLCLRLAGWSWRRTTLSCALLSLGIEISQYFWIPGRDASLSDVLSNTTGAAIGAALAPRLRLFLAPSQRTAWLLTVTGTGVWLAIALVSSWLFLPPNHLGTRALVERADQTSRRDAYEGTLASASLSGHSYPGGVLDEASSRRLREAFASESIDVELNAVSESPNRCCAWLFRVWMGAAGLVVRQRGRDLTLQVPRRAARLRIGGPALRLVDGAPDAAGIPFRVSGGERGAHVWLESTVRGRTRRVEMFVVPTMAWSLLIPYEYAMGPEARLVTWLCLGGLMLPLGYWAARTRRPCLALIVPAIAVACGLGLIPWATGVRVASRSDWAAALAGLAVGWAAGRLAAYLASRCGSPSASDSSSS